MESGWHHSSDEPARDPGLSLQRRHMAREQETAQADIVGFVLSGLLGSLETLCVPGTLQTQCHCNSSSGLL